MEPTQDFRRLLQQEFLRRQKVNASYSIRAYARFLGINHASLSHLLSGKRAFSSKSIRRLGLRLGLTPKKIDQLSASQKKARPETPFNLMTEEVFLSLQDWYHDAILELVKVEGFQAEAKWIANRLGISVVEAQAAFERLKKLGFLKHKEDGSWEGSWADNSTQLNEVTTSAALRNYQKSLLEKSTEALETVPIEERFQSSLVVAIDPEDLSQIREMVKDFRRELNRFASRPKTKPKAVYAMLFSGFEL